MRHRHPWSDLSVLPDQVCGLSARPGAAFGAVATAKGLSDLVLVCADTDPGYVHAFIAYRFVLGLGGAYCGYCGYRIFIRVALILGCVQLSF